MAYLDEGEVWKCPSHPTRRRRYGVCPACLREKLSTLCPDCAALRPCSCSSSSSSSSSSASSASSSSFSRFFSSSSSRSSSAVPDPSVTGKVSHLIDSEPSFRRSRSVATLNLPSFLRSRSKFVGRDANPDVTPPLPATSTTRTVTGSGSSFWGKFRRDSSKRADGGLGADEERRMMMTKSRSVAVTSSSACTTDMIYGEHNGNSTESRKGRSWSRYFPRPMKVLGSHRHSISGSPLYRG
ncbi:hypothetical protein MLD38_019734 [Melastoma candidum]|uniref:Uncharacterized protein n=1 Tax=Melastoma candidum TaxID=119954 RepID=A0ACB9QX34_9MYRT|nr:hypothetical protein MLD38_019734 [Melastoma candidum]